MCSLPLFLCCCCAVSSRLVSFCFVRLLQTFHDEEWAGKIGSKEGSSVVEMTGASHWFMLDKPDIVNDRLDAFFASD